MMPARVDQEKNINNAVGEIAKNEAIGWHYDSTLPAFFSY